MMIFELHENRLDYVIMMGPSVGLGSFIANKVPTKVFIITSFYVEDLFIFNYEDLLIEIFH